MNRVTPSAHPATLAPMPSPLPRRTLADWTPEAGDVTEWLARWEAAHADR